MYREGDYATQVDVYIINWRLWEDSPFPPPDSIAPHQHRCTQTHCQGNPHHSTSSSSSNGLPSEPTVDLSAWSPRSRQAATPPDTLSLAQKSTYQPKTHFPIVLSDCPSSVTHQQARISAIGNLNPFQTLAWISRFLQACPLITLNPISINYQIALRTVKYHSVTSTIAEGKTSAIYTHTTYSDQDSFREVEFKRETSIINCGKKVLGAAPGNPNFNLRCTQIVQIDSQRQELMLWSEKTPQQVIIQALCSHWASFFEQMLLTHGPHFSQGPPPLQITLFPQSLPPRPLSHPDLLATQGPLRSTQAMLSPCSPLRVSPILSAPHSPSLSQGPQHMHSPTRALSSPSPPMHLAPSHYSSSSNQTDTQSPPPITNSPNSPLNMSMDADSITPPPQLTPASQPRRQRATKLPTRRSERLQARLRSTETDANLLTRNKNATEKIPFDLQTSLSSLDADRTIQILRATGLHITDQVKQLIDEAINQDTVSTDTELSMPSTPLHDLIPPMTVPGTDLIL